MTGTYDLFDAIYPEYKSTKPVRLIEFFGGIGSQAKALERLGVDFETYRLVEIDQFAVNSYNAIHGTEFSTSDITQLHGEDLSVVSPDKYDELAQEIREFLINKISVTSLYLYQFGRKKGGYGRRFRNGILVNLGSTKDFTGNA